MTDRVDVDALVARALLIASDEGCVESGIILALAAALTSATEREKAAYARGLKRASDYLRDRAFQHDHAGLAVYADKEAPARHALAADECRFSADSILALKEDAPPATEPTP